MVSAVSSIGRYPVNKEILEVVRRLQSLGVAPSGNLTVDRQKLQTAEYLKKQVTLAANSEVNLSKLEGTGKDFSSTFSSVQNAQPTNSVVEVQSKKISSNDMNYSKIQDKAHFNESENNHYKYSMIGANQIAELNKLQLGLIA